MCVPDDAHVHVVTSCRFSQAVVILPSKSPTQARKNKNKDYISFCFGGGGCRVEIDMYTYMVNWQFRGLRVHRNGQGVGGKSSLVIERYVGIS